MDDRTKTIEGAELKPSESRSAAIIETKSKVEPVSENVLRRHIKEDPKKALLAEHKAWLNDIQHEFPMPYIPYKIGVSSCRSWEKNCSRRCSLYDRTGCEESDA